MSLAFNSSTTASNLIVVAATWNSSTYTTITCSDSQSNVYSPVVYQNDATNSQMVGVCYAPNIAAGATTVTVAWGGAPSNRALSIHEYSGVATANPLDVTTGTTAVGTTATDNISSGSVTTNVDGALIFGAIEDTTGNPTSATAGTGFTSRTNTGAVGANEFNTEDLVQTNAGSIAATMTYGDNAQRYAALVLAFRPAGSVPTTQGDGVGFYGETGNTNPRSRLYYNVNNTFTQHSNTVAGGIPASAVIRTSPTKQEAVAAYVTTGGTLYVACFDGSSWVNGWNVSVGGTATTQRFDVSYETSSGDVVVMYSTNTATTNELAYRTKAGNTGCGSANWSSATNVDPVRTAGVVQWVNVAWDRRGSSDLVTAIWADEYSDLSAMQWSGSTWGNEPSAALETSLEVEAAPQDIDNFDVAYESLSGDVLVAWSNTTSIRTAQCNGGTSACTWTAAALMPEGAIGDGQNVSLAANPRNNQIAWAALTDEDPYGGVILTGYWTGTTWQNYNVGLDLYAQNVNVAGRKTLTTGWLSAGGTTRSLIVVVDDSTGVLNAWLGDGDRYVLQANPYTFGASASTLEFSSDPMDLDRGMLTAVEGSNYWSKRVVMNSSGALTWTNADGGSALTSSIAQAGPSAAAYAYWRNPPTLAQSGYGWFANANSVQPGSSLASQNTAASLTGAGSPVRLRTQVGVTGMSNATANQPFTLQYGTSTSGPWSSVEEKWWNGSWTARRKVTFENQVGNSNLANFPVMVSLTSSNIDYAKTQNAGEDLRFVDTDGTALSYSIEKWNESGTSIAWVKVPQIDGGSNTDHIWMYYGNAGASDGQSAAAVWDASTAMVQQFEETSACPVTFTDPTSNANNGNCSSGTPTSGAGKIGDGRGFDATDDFVMVPDSASLSPATEITVSGWVNQTGLAANKSIVAKWDYTGGNSTNETWAFQTASTNTALRVFLASNGTDDGNNYADTAAGTFSTGWHHVAFVFDGSRSATVDRLKVYIDGINQPLTYYGNIDFDLENTASDIRIGDFQGLNRWWNGGIDQIEIDSTPRSADWIATQYRSGNNALNTFGSEEANTTAAWRYHDNATPAHGATVSSTVLTGSTTNQSYQEQAISPANPNGIAAGSYGEWDFALDPATATMNTPYYFRMIKSDGTALSAYTHYPQVGVNSTLNQAAYRFYANADGTTIGSALAAQDTAASSPVQGTAFRLRTAVDVSAINLGIGEAALKLQVATQSGSCDTGFSGETYADVTPSTGAIRFYDNTTPADGATASADANDPIYSGHTKRMQTYEEQNNSATVTATAAGEAAVWDFSLVDNSAVAGTTYCFRLLRSDDTPLNTYTVVPQITTAVTNTAPSSPSSLAQTKNNNPTYTSLSVGAWNNSTTVRFTATVSDPDGSDTDAICVEAKAIASAFTNSEDACSSLVAQGGTASMTLTLADATEYHWQARTKDAGGLYSSWVSFGGNSDTLTAASDVGIDTTAPTGGTVYDGTAAGVDAAYNDGSLSSLSANWSGTSVTVSGLSLYEYSIGTTAGGTDVRTWTNNSTTASVTATGLTLSTSQTYYFNVRVTDNAGNVSGTISSNGQAVAPMLTFAVDSMSVDFDPLRPSNSYTDTQSLEITTSTNGVGGYVVRQYATTPSAGSSTISGFSGGTYASPDSWQGGDTGFGYTSSDTNVQSVNKFQAGTCPGGSAVAAPGCYAPLATAGPGDIVADNTAPVSGTPILNEQFTLTYRVTATATQTAGSYSGIMFLSAVVSF